MKSKYKKMIFWGMMVIFIATYLIMTFTKCGNIGIKEYNQLGLLDLKTDGYSVDFAKQAMDGLGTYGRKLADCYYIIDYIFLASFCVVQMMLTGVIKRCLKKSTKVSQIVVLISYVLAIIKFALDFIEDTLVEVMLHSSSKLPDGLYQFTSFCTQAKLVAALLWGPVLAILVIILVVDKRRK